MIYYLDYDLCSCFLRRSYIRSFWKAFAVSKNLHHLAKVSLLEELEAKTETDVFIAETVYYVSYFVPCTQLKCMRFLYLNLPSEKTVPYDFYC